MSGKLHQVWLIQKCFTQEKMFYKIKIKPKQIEKLKLDYKTLSEMFCKKTNFEREHWSSAADNKSWY